MALPIKIDPDNLKQSIVHIKFDAKIPIELISGKFFEVLQAIGFTYIPAPRPAVPMPIKQQFAKIELSNGWPGAFHNSKIKLQILEPGHLIFTMFSSYIGWEEYFKNIQQVLQEFAKLDIVTNYKNIGLRYISEYISEPIEPIIKSSFSWNIKGKELNNDASHYKTEIKEKNRRIVINIASLVERHNQAIQSVERVSVIDIDVICPLQTDEVGMLINEIDISHTLEKEYFFGLLTDEYVSSINPIY